MEKLYDVQFDVIGDDVTTHMYYRSDCVLFSDGQGGKILPEHVNFDFFTYYNSLSINKWRTYTTLEEFSLIIEAKGMFELHLFGHYQGKNGSIKKEYISRQKIVADKQSKIVVDIPADIFSTVVGFSIYPLKESKLYSAYYAVKTDGLCGNSVNVSLITTTYKKEEYINRNIRLLNNQLFSNEFFADAYHWFIIDNGQTIDKNLENENISIIYNKNIGGAGGFARGMIESVSNTKFTHVLLMDDDVIISVESFKRLYFLLKYIKDEYEGNFISGAMLKMEEPNMQHEDIGVFDSDGSHHPAKRLLDLNTWDSIVINEEYKFSNDKHYYAGWWFCCVPSKYVRNDNLPLPIFVRGDDVEYSLRNHPGFITINGICIWHEGFEGKFSAALELYQVERNDLIVCSMLDELNDVDVIGRIERLFWEELYKFNYLGASLLLDAIEDYLKGPDYVFSLDGEKIMKEKKKQDNVLEPMTDSVSDLLKCGKNIYDWVPVKKIRKFVYDYTYNGQARIPQILLKKQTSIIPYGWGYNPGRMCLCNKIIAVDLYGKKYTVFIKKRKVFKELLRRHHTLINHYNNSYISVSEKYKACRSNYLSVNAWNAIIN